LLLPIVSLDQWLKVKMIRSSFLSLAQVQVS
jgi:hypothetical protein